MLASKREVSHGLTAMPIKGCAATDARLFREGRRFVLLELISACQTRISIDLSAAYFAAERIDPSRAWSPNVYYSIFNIVQSMFRGERAPIVDALHALSIFSTKTTYDSKLRISSILTEEWEASFVHHMREYEPRGRDGSGTIVLPLLGDRVLRHRRIIQEALKVLDGADPHLGDEFSTLVTRIKLFDGRVLRGETANRVFGSMFIRLPPDGEDEIGYWIEHIVHETSHLRLETLGGVDPLILNPPGSRFSAPIRRDPRPMSGIMHATFVLARMVRIFRQLADQSPAYAERLRLLRLQFEKGMAVIEQEALLTDEGWQLVSTLRPCADG